MRIFWLPNDKNIKMLLFFRLLTVILATYIVPKQKIYAMNDIRYEIKDSFLQYSIRYILYKIFKLLNILNLLFRYIYIAVHNTI